MAARDKAKWTIPIFLKKATIKAEFHLLRKHSTDSNQHLDVYSSWGSYCFDELIYSWTRKVTAVKTPIQDYPPPEVPNTVRGHTGHLPDWPILDAQQITEKVGKKMMTKSPIKTARFICHSFKLLFFFLWFKQDFYHQPSTASMGLLKKTHELKNNVQLKSWIK